jgi:ABC-2 type transport system permease protein
MKCLVRLLRGCAAAMQSSIFYLPGLVGVITGMLTVLLTAFAIVRERENGTIEQLNVSPLRRGELIVGKLVPYVVITYAQVILVLKLFKLYHQSRMMYLWTI